MSMSTLGAQLASLSSSTTTNTTTTSRRPEDAIGRGLYHSSLHGHSLHPSSSSHHQNTKLKPSVLHADAKSASDIPLSSIRTAALSALQSLYVITGNEEFISKKYKGTLMGTHSLSYERGLQTLRQNNKTDELIGKLLCLLSTVMSEPSTSSSSSCESPMHYSLCVIEYLLRRYDIHLRPTTSHYLLLYTLPHHNHNQAVFVRILQIIDLTNTTHDWSFLRPFAAPGCDAPPRSVIAKRLSKEDGIVECLCDLVVKVGLISQMEGFMLREKKKKRVGMEKSSSKSGGGGVVVRRGISHVISFVAAVITEALSVQALDPSNKGSVKESTVRVLLPHLLSFCSGGGANNNTTEKEDESSKKKKKLYYTTACADQTNFGYVLASCLVEHADLNMKVKEAICTSIIKGLLLLQQQQSGKEEEEEEEFTKDQIESASNGILTVMSILLSSRGEQGEKKEEKEETSFLPCVESGTKHFTTKKKKKQQKKKKKKKQRLFLGCHLPKSTYQLFLKSFAAAGGGGGGGGGDDDTKKKKHEKKQKSIVSCALGYIYNVREVDVSVVVSSLLAKALNQVIESGEQDGKQKKKRRKKRKKEEESALNLILDLIKEPSLSSVWQNTNNNLTSSVAAFTVNKFASPNVNGDNDNKNDDDDDNDNNNNMMQDDNSNNNNNIWSKKTLLQLEQCKSILDSLHSADNVGCDAGVAYAVTHLADDDDDDDHDNHHHDNDEKKKKKEERLQYRRGRVVLLLQKSNLGVDASSIAALPSSSSIKTDKMDIDDDDDGENKEKSNNDIDDDNDNLVNLLPPRVALEHPDSSVRLVAIERLLEEEIKEKASTTTATAVIDYTLVQSLLRRIASDGEESVVVAAGKALEVVERNIDAANKDNDHDNDDEEEEENDGLFGQDLMSCAEYILNALQKWSILEDIIGATNSPAVKKKKRHKKKKGDIETETDGDEDDDDDKNDETDDESKKTTALDSALSKERLEAICVILHLAGSVLSAMLLEKERMMEDSMYDEEEEEDYLEMLYKLVYSVAALVDLTTGFDLDDSCKKAVGQVERAASFALVRGIDSDDDGNTNDDESFVIKKAMKMLSANEVCNDALNHCCNIEEGEDKQDYRKKLDVATRRFMGLSLTSHIGALEASSTSEKNISNEQHLSNALSTLVSILHLYDDTSSSSSSTKVKKRDGVFPCQSPFLLNKLQACLAYTVKIDVYQVPDAFIKLASVESSSAYNLVSAEAIRAIIKRKKGDISSMLLLMEACARQEVENFAIVRLITIACGIVDQTAYSTCIEQGLIPAFSLLAHTDRNVREGALQFLEAILFKKVDKANDGAKAKESSIGELCRLATEKSSTMRSAILMDGASALPLLLSQAVQKSKNPSVLREVFLNMCTLGLSRKRSKNSMLLSLARTPGRCNAAAIILSSMSTAGESAFPLSQRWKYAGSELFSAFLLHGTDGRAEKQSGSSELEQPILSESVKSLVESVVLMLKGVIVTHGTSATNDFVITTGPSSSGRRSRSYSVGATDDITVINPYPEEMALAILRCLSSTAKGKGPAHMSELQNFLIRLVLSRRSWAENIFPKLDTKTKRKIVANLLTLRSVGNNESAGAALLMLPLDSDDFFYLIAGLKEKGPVALLSSDEELLALTFLADCIRGRCDDLAKDKGVLKLSNVLFDRVSSLSASDSNYSGSDYTRICLLQTLLALHENIESQKIAESDVKATPLGPSKQRYSSQASLLVSLIGGEERRGKKSSVRPLSNGNGKAVALGLLTHICSEAPATVVDSLIPAMLQLCATSSTKTPGSGNGADFTGTSQIKSCGQALLAVIPSFCARAHSAGLSLPDLLKAFVTSFHSMQNIHPQQKLELYKYFVDALLAISSESRPHKALSDLIGYFFAVEIYYSENVGSNQSKDSMEVEGTESTQDSTDFVSFALGVLHHAPITTQVHSSLQLLRYTGDLIKEIESCESASKLPDSSTSKSSSKKLSFNVDGFTLATVATVGPEGSSKKATKATNHKNTMMLSSNILRVIKGGLSSKEARKLIRKSEGDVADMCLRLWQELMQLQANTIHFQSREADETISLVEKEFFKTVPNALSDCRECLQRLLPVPHFLASVSSLLQDEEIEHSVRKRAIQLLSERALEIDPLSAEASLFLELVPDLVEQVTDMSIKDEGEIAARQAIVVQQGALISIECLARTFCLSSGKKNIKGVGIFLNALSKLSNILNVTGKKIIKCSPDDSKVPLLDDAKSQLLSSTAICASTLVRVVGSKCLPFLQKLMRPLLSSLSSVNSWLVNANNKEENQAARLLQLSLLRALVAVTETVPQFLVPYLGDILSPLGLPSWALRQESSDGDNSVQSMSENLDLALASGTPARQLIPAASKAVQNALAREENGMGWREAQSIFSIMKSSIDASPRSEINPVIGKLINALLLGYGYDNNRKGRNELLSSANECLLAIVMKLSENQLRPLYARLREWRGEVDESEIEKTSCSRRYAFWSLSAALSKELRSIFLPCLSSVIGDAVAELDFAVTRLCSSPYSSKSSGGKKRRRLEHSGEHSIELSNEDELSPLQPLLHCLELSLKADAHEGGGWARSDDGQRYNAILNPLGKLLEASIPPNFPIHCSLEGNKLTTTSSFQQLVSGVGTMEHGSVVACLTALAAAAGNEQLWKPLNHAILQACGNDSRLEVRKAGVGALLTIIQTLGEEYMVLLPECLPILSELLEDGDEEIASLAKECIRQGEELLGESLDDSLI